MGLSCCKFWILLVGCKYEINNMSALQHTKAQLDIHNAPRHASSYVYTNKEHCLIDTVHTCTRITQLLVFLPKVWKLGNYYSVEYVNYLYMKLNWTLQQHESLYWNDSSTQVLISSLFCTQYKLFCSIWHAALFILDQLTIVIFLCVLLMQNSLQRSINFSFKLKLLSCLYGLVTCSIVQINSYKSTTFGDVFFWAPLEDDIPLPNQVNC